MKKIELAQINHQKVLSECLITFSNFVAVFKKPNIGLIFQRELSIIDFTLNYPPIRNNLTSASLLSMLIETDFLNYPPIRNNLTSASLLSMIIETDYNLVGYESHDRAVLPRRNLPRQKYIFPFAKHLEV